MATTAIAKETSENGSSAAAEKNGSSHKLRPVYAKRSFPLQVAVFEFPTTDGPPNFSVKLTRSFRRDDDSDWEATEYLSGKDLLRAAKLLEAADSFVQHRLEADYQARKATAAETNDEIPF